MAKFEIISKYQDAGLALPERKTRHSAGYDFQVAEDIIIYPYEHLMTIFKEDRYQPYALSEMADITKKLHTRPTLVPTGIKCQLDPGTYLELSVRSSSPLKYWLVLANGVGK